MKKKLLYIDDNPTNLAIFQEKFSHKFKITISTEPTSIFNLLEGTQFDVILLDIHMPDRDGFAVLKEISESRFSSIPVLMYTSDELQAIRYQALASSASDIIYRTLSDEEIALRIMNKVNLFGKRREEKKHISIDQLNLNIVTHEAFFGPENLNLTPIEFKILAALVKNFPEKITRKEMALTAWGCDDVPDRTVNTHLTNLRNKLPKDDFTIESPRGTGIVLKKNSKISPISFVENGPSNHFNQL